MTWAHMRVVIDGLASMHARLYGDSALRDAELSLCTSAQLFTAFSPEAVSRHSACPHGLLPYLNGNCDLTAT